MRDNASLTRPAYHRSRPAAHLRRRGLRRFRSALAAHPCQPLRRRRNPAIGLRARTLARRRPEGGRCGARPPARRRRGRTAEPRQRVSVARTTTRRWREKLQTGELPLPEFFGQLLRLVYRLIFLLAAEDRNLLHPPGCGAAARKLYAEGYSVGSLRDRAVRRSAWDRHHDRWEGLLVTFAALARGEPRLGLPALGGLFAPELMPDLEAARLSNRSLMEAIYRLAWLKDDPALVPVNWRDMETEELGSVYESLLELTPRLTDDGRGFAFAEGGEAKGHARKTTGSYYTPDSLVQALLDQRARPGARPGRGGRDRSGRARFSPSRCSIPPAVRAISCWRRRGGSRRGWRGPAPAASPRRPTTAMRCAMSSRACIHGVDRNPMAVELTKVALWIETVEPGKPLGFLDANIRCGDALLGVFDLDALQQGIPDAAYKPLAGDDKETAKHFRSRNREEREGQGALDFAAAAASSLHRPRSVRRSAR